MKTLLLMTSVLLMTPSCRTSERSLPKIIGGTPVAENSEVAKLSVAFINKSSGRLFCSGFFITETHVITAAHCVAPHDSADGFNESVTLYVGHHIQTGREVRVKSVAIHPNFNRLEFTKIEPLNPPYDLAILSIVPEVSQQLRLEQNLVPTLAREVSVGASLFILGFGIDDAAERTGAGILRKASVKLSRLNAAAKEIIIDVEDQKSACRGDSGGPALIAAEDGRLQLVATSSRGSALCDDVAIYTDVTQNLPWIESIVRPQP